MGEVIDYFTDQKLEMLIHCIYHSWRLTLNQQELPELTLWILVYTMCLKMCLVSTGWRGLVMGYIQPQVLEVASPCYRCVTAHPVLLEYVQGKFWYKGVSKYS